MLEHRARVLARDRAMQSNLKMQKKYSSYGVNTHLISLTKITIEFINSSHRKDDYI
jgi:hypothetical protein